MRNGLISRVSSVEQHFNDAIARDIKAVYSAAAARIFALAAVSMKSEMRGTISDLNREPLNTP